MWEYAEEINNSRRIYYYGKYIQKAGDRKRKNVEDERVKVLGSASYGEINVIKKTKQQNNTHTTTLQYLTIPTCIDFKFISWINTSSIIYREREERERERSAEMLNITVNGRRATVTKGK